MRVLVLKGQAAYNVVRLFTDEVAEAFARAGWAVAMIDASATPDILREVERRASEGPINLVFSFGAFGEVVDGRSIGDRVDAPHVVHHLDYPLSHWDRLERTCPKAALLVIDPSHAEAIREVYGPDRFAFVGFSPHGAVGGTLAPAESAAEFTARRAIPILFPGTFYRPSPPPWLDLEPPERQIVAAALEIALGAEGLPALAALDAALRSYGFDPAAAAVRPFRRVANWVHEHVRASRRVRLLETADSLDLPLLVLGDNYEAELGRFRSISFGGASTVDGAITHMARARVVLNVNANFASGSHERPLTAMNAGAAAASDYSAFYAERFRENVEISLFRWGDLERGLERVAALAEDGDLAFAMAAAGRRAVREGHLWRHRLEAILKAGEAARIARGAKGAPLI